MSQHKTNKRMNRLVAELVLVLKDHGASWAEMAMACAAVTVIALLHMSSKARGQSIELIRNCLDTAEGIE